MDGTDLLIVFGASALGALIKGVTGMGYPIVAVPLISLALGVEDAVVIVAVPNFAANAYLIWEAREARGESRDLPRLLVPGVLGAIVGTILLVDLPEEPLALTLAATVVAFVVLTVTHPERTTSLATAHRWSPAVGVVTGLFQGAIGVSGPIVASWFHGYRLPTQAYVFTITTVFGITGLAQIVVLAVQGEFDADRVLALALAGVAVATMIPLGLHLRSRLDRAGFERAVLGVLSLSAVALVADALL